MSQFQSRLFVAALLLGTACGSVWADDLTSEQTYLQEFPVVLSASRLSQPLSEVPNAMTVIDRKMIVASGFRTIPDLFKLVPGMYVSYYKAGQGFVSYHGSTDQYARRMQVMIDGRSVYLPPISTVNWADLPITVDDIDRIEVIRGPAAASHGANSTQGVISITTRDAAGKDGKSISMTRGSQGINDVSARFGKRGEIFDYRMTLAYTADNGYDALGSPPNNIPITQFQANTLLNNSNDSNQARLLNYRADYHPNSIDSFDVQFGFNHDIQGVGFSDRNTGTNGNPYHDLIANSGFLQLGWTRVLGNESDLNMRYYHIQQNQHEEFPAYVGGKFFPGPITQWTKTGRDEIELQHSLRTTDSNRLVYGAAYRADQVDAFGDIPIQAFKQTYSSSNSMNEWRVFAHDEWRFTPRLLLNTGAMFERNRMGHENTSPRVAVNFHVAPQHTLRVGTSVAYRTPSLVEERYPQIQPGALFVPNAVIKSPGLKPERLMSHEMGYLGEFSSWSSSLDLRVFSDLVSDGIYVASSGKFANGMSSSYQGIETTLKHFFRWDGDLTANFAHELASSNGNALFMAGQKTLQSRGPTTNDIVSGSTPKNNVSLLYSQRLPNHYSLSVAYYRQDAMQPFDRGAIDYQPIQNRTDVRIAKAFSTNGMKGDVAFVVQNLFKSDYTEYIASNLFNQRSYLTFKLDW